MESLDPSFLDHILRTLFPDFEEEVFSWEKLTLPPRRERGRGIRESSNWSEKGSGKSLLAPAEYLPGLAGRWQ